jgi:hypothetical protein
MIILRSMSCTGYVARNVEITTAYDTSIRNLNRRLSATTKHSKTSNLKVEVKEIIIVHTTYYKEKHGSFSSC